MPGRKLQILFVLILLAAAAFIIATRPSSEENNRAAAFYHDLSKSLAPLPPADYRVYRDAGM